MRKIYSWYLFESIIYDVNWQKLMPKFMTILKDGTHNFKIGNVMKNADMIQVTYENEKGEVGVPSTLEFDFYFSENSNTRIDVDITWGDAMACEFFVEAPSKVGVIEYTSYGSKTDPSNTVFALDDKCLGDFVTFLNQFDGIRVTIDQFTFLDKRDNFDPSRIG
jgi:hypothetical protein